MKQIMLYENYANKIQKLANAKNFIVRFRVLILSCLSAVIALAIAYTSSKGALVNGISIAPSFVYGQELEYSSEAFLSEVVGYQFMSKKDGVWSSEEPINAGEYYIRAVTEKISGYRYSTPTPFEITPKNIELNIENSTIVYGSYPDYEVKGLEYGDQLSGVGFKFDSLTEQKTLVNPVLDAVLIRNTDGEDVTGNYTISTGDAEITFLKRDISVAPMYLGKVYDGTNIDYANTYTITSSYQLGYEDKLEITTMLKNEAGEVVTEAIEPGKYTLTVETITLNGSEDLGNYDIEKEEHTFEISKRSLLVSTKDLEKTYDAKELKGNNDGDYFVSEESPEELLKGHKLSLSNDIAASILNYGSVSNEYEVIVVDSNGNNLEKYYDISYDYGSLTINKKDVTITTEGAEFTYDGQAHSANPTYEISGLIDSHVETVSGFASIINVEEGEVDNSCVVAISDGENDVTGNYNIINNYGKLKVNPTEIKVKPIISDEIYDGRTYDANSANFDVISGQTYNGAELSILVNYNANDTSYNTVSDSGKYVINGFDFVINNGLKSNYTVSFEAGSFEIFKRDVKISLIDQVYTYDSQTFVYPSNQIKVEENSFVYDMSLISVSVKFATKGKDTDPINVGEYDISYVTLDEGALRNHNVSCDTTAKLKIVEKAIYIKPYINENDVVVYDGQQYVYNSNAFTIVNQNDGGVYDNNLPWGGEINNVEVEYYQIDENNNYVKALPVNAGTYYVKVVDFTCTLETNYAFNKDLTTKLVIKERDVVIAPHITTLTKVYDGMYYNYDTTSYRVVKDNNLDVLDTYQLLTGDALELQVTYNDVSEAPINVGTYDIKGLSYTCSTLTENNYNIIISDTISVTYEVTPFELTISPVAQNSCVYDGSAHYYDGQYIVLDKDGNTYSSELLYNEKSGMKDSIHNIKVLYNDQEEAPINAGTYNVIINEWYSDDVTKTNYSVTFDGTVDLTINKRKVAIAPYLSTRSAIYGEEYSYISSEYKVIDMENNSYQEFDNHFPWDQAYIDNVTVNYHKDGNLLDSKPVNRGTYLVTVNEYSYHGEENYEFVANPLEFYFEIQERNVVVAPYITEFGKTYDGKQYVYDSNMYVVLYDNGLLVSDMHELLPGNSLQLVVQYNGIDEAPLNAGTYNINAVGYICDEFTENNYNITLSDTEYVTYVISPVIMSIKPIVQPDNVYYNGDVQNYDADKFEIISGEFVGNERELVTVKTSINDVAVDAKEYYISIDSVIYATPEAEINYDINYETTTLFEVKARPLTLTLNGQDAVTYDGNVHEYLGGYTVADGLNNTVYEANTLPFTNVLTGLKDSIAGLDLRYNDGTNLPVNANTYEVTALDWVASEYTIKSNYNISFTEAKTTMEISKRVVIIAPYISENYFVFDGEMHTYNETEFKVVKDNDVLMNFTYSLHTNDELSVGVRYVCEEDNDTGLPLNAGTYRVYLTGEFNASSLTKQNYDIRFDLETYETITITKRNITIIPYVGNANSKTYDGKEYVYDINSYEIIYDNNNIVHGIHELAEGNSLQVSVKYNSSRHGSDTPLNADTYQIRIDNVTYGGLAERNYNVRFNDYEDYNYVTYTINPVVIIIRPELSETEVYYTGQKVIYEVTGYSYHFGEFVEGESITFETTVPDTCVNVGTYSVTIDPNSVQYVNALYYNYLIDFAPGELEIIARPITISPVGMDSVIYDGKEHGYTNEFIVTDMNGDVYNNELPCTNVLNNNERDRVDSLTVRYNGSDELPLNAREYLITIVDWESLSKDNYDVTFVENTEAKFEIEKREISIAPYIDDEAMTKTYDGLSYEYNSNKYVIIDSLGEPDTIIDLTSFDKAVLPWGGTIFNVTVKYLQGENIVDPVNVGDYEVMIDSWRYLGIENYIITNSGEKDEFEIIKRDIKISLIPQKSIDYTGEEYEYPTNRFIVYDKTDGKEYISKLPCCELNGTSCEHLDNIVVEVVDDLKVIDAGTYYFVLDQNQENFNEITDNYNVSISTEPLEFVIKRRKATITLTMNEEMKFYYNGNEALWAENYEISIDRFVEGEEVKVVGTVEFAPINVGEYTVTPVVFEFTSAKESNYDIEYVSDQFFINPAQIRFVLEDGQSVVYNGNEQEFTGKVLIEVLTDNSFDDVELTDLPYHNASSNTKDTILNIDFMYNDVYHSVIHAKEYSVQVRGWEFDELSMNNYVVVDYSDTASFEITKRPISIAPFIDEEAKVKVYDGLSYVYDTNKFRIIDSLGDPDAYIDLEDANKSALPWGGFIYDVTVKYLQDGNPVNPVNAGDYEVIIDTWKYDYYGEFDYIITNSNLTDTFTIDKRSILISLISQKPEEYNGKEHFYPTNVFKVYDKTNGWIYTSTLPCCGFNGVTCEHLSDIKVEVVDNEKVIDAGTYYFVISSDLEQFKEISDNYDVSVSTEPLEFIVNPRKVTIFLVMDDTVTYYYNGKEASWQDDYTITKERFVEGEEVKVIGVADVAPINAGEYTITPVVSEYVTAKESNYSITYISDTFTIKPAEIKFVLEDGTPVVYNAEKQEYNGKFLIEVLTDDSFDDIELNDLPYHNESNDTKDTIEIKFYYNGSFTIPVNAGKYTVKVGSYSFDDITAQNYKVVDRKDTALFEITKRNIKITPVLDGDPFKIYDANPYLYTGKKFLVEDLTPDVEVKEYDSSLPFNDPIKKLDVLYKVLTDEKEETYNNIANIINADKYLITFSGWQSDVWFNYDVSYGSVKFEVTPRPIEIMPFIPNIPLDRIVGKYTSQMYEYNSNYYSIIDMDGKIYNNDLPCKNDITNKISNVLVEYYQKNENGEFVKALPINAGTYYVKVIENSWVHTGITRNYSISVSDEEFIIIIDQLDLSISYDLGNKDNVLGPYIAQEYELPNKNEFKYNDDNRLFGTDEIRVESSTNEPLLNAGTYAVNISSIEFISGNKGNYDIKLVPVDIIIEKAKVDVAPIDQVSDYSGNEYQYPSDSYIINTINGVYHGSNKLLLDEEILLNVKYAPNGEVHPITHGEYTIYGDFVSADELVLNNYSFEFPQTAKLIINKLNITVAPIFAERLYGQSYQYSPLSCEVYGTLGENDKVSLYVYYIDKINGDVYLGNSNRSDLPLDLQAKAKDGYPINVGIYYSYISKTVIKGVSEDRTDNYNITSGSNLYEIVTNEIKFELVDQKDTYDGEEVVYTFDKVKIAKGKLIQSDQVIVNVYYINNKTGKVYLGNSNISDLPKELQNNVVAGYPVDAGEYSIYISKIEIVSERSNNYSVSWIEEPHKLTIDKRTVEFVIVVENSKELVYNFGSLTPRISITYTYSDKEKQLALDHSIKPTEYQFYNESGKEISINDIINAGKYSVDVTGYEYIKGSDDNYTIDISKAFFRVAPLTVEIELANQLKPYDGSKLDKIEIISVNSPNNPSVADKVSKLKFDITKVKGVSDLFTTTEMINASVYDVEIVGWKLSAGVDNLDSNFDVTTKEGCTYTITPLTVDLLLKTQEFTYNGGYNSYNKYELNGVLSNQTMVPVFTFTKDDTEYTEKELIHYGRYNITPPSTYTLYDDEGNIIVDKNANYVFNISGVDSTVYIKQLEITLNTKNQDIYYTNGFIKYDKGLIDVDGKEIPDYRFITYNVYYLDCKDPTIEVVNPYEVGSYYILIDKSSIKISNGTYNDYIINVEEDLDNVGVLTIKKAKIDITCYKTTATYGNLKSITTSYKMLSGFSVSFIIHYYDEKGNLVVDEEGLPMTPRNVGTYHAVIYDFVLRYNGSIIEDKSNFEINVLNPDDAILNITPKTIYIRGQHYAPVEYSGKPIERPEQEYYHTSLGYNDKLTIETEIYYNGQKHTTDILHAGDYTIVLVQETLKFTVGTADNYTFKYYNGSYKINPKPIEIQIVLPDKGKTYDGESVNVNWIYSDLQNNSPVFDDVLSISFIYNIRRVRDSYLGDGIVDKVEDAGSYTISMNTEYQVSGTTGSYPTDYAVSCINDGLGYKIERKEIKVITPSVTVYYSGYSVEAKEGFGLQDGYELVEGHKLGWDQKDYTIVSEYEIVEDGKTNRIGALVVDENKRIVADNYYISSTEYGTIRVLKRPVIIKSGSGSNVYSGSRYPYECNEFTYEDDVNNLIEGVLLPELNPEIIDSMSIDGIDVTYVTQGSVENTFILSAKLGRYDVGKNFAITPEYGTVYVTVRDLTVSLNPDYDNSEYWYTGSPVDVSGHILTDVNITSTGDEVNEELSLRFFRLTDAEGNRLPSPIEETTMTNAGLYQVVLGDVVINKRSGENILTENYNIYIDDTVSQIYVTIKPLKLDVYTHERYKVWDGEDLSNHDFTYNTNEFNVKNGYGLLENHSIDVDPNGNNACIPAYDAEGNKIVNMVIENDLEYIIYDITTGEVVTNNYIIVPHNHTIGVVESIKLHSFDSGSYTGKEHSVSKVSGTFKTEGGSYSIENLRFEVNVTHGTMIDIGYYELTPILDTIKIYLNGEEVTDDYKQDFVDYELTYFISHRYIHMRPKDLEVTYDGKDHACTPDEFADGINYEVFNGSLLEGHYAEIETTRKFLATSTRVKSFDDNMIESVIIRDKDGNDVTHLYNINFTGSGYSEAYMERFKANLIVNKIPFRNSSGSIEVDYDGKYHSCEEFYYDSEALLPGHQVKIINFPEFIDASRNNKNDVEFDIVDENDFSVKQFYNCSGEYSQKGKIIINQISLTITSATKTFTFMPGEVFSCKEYTVSDGLIKGHTIEVVINTEIKNRAGTFVNEVDSYTIRDEYGNDVTYNYDVDLVLGSIIIEQNLDLIE